MPRLLHERATSFASGMNDTAAITDYKADEVRLLENGRPSFSGNAVERRNGSQKTHATAINGGAQCWGATEYFDASGNQQIIAFFGTKAFKSTDRGATWVDITGGLTLTENWYTFAQMQVGNSSLLICANGATNILKWDGTTLANLGGSPPAGVKIVVVFNDRLYVTGHNGIEIKASKVADPENWNTTQGAFTVRAQTHEGDNEIRGMYQVGSALLVFKRDSTNYLEGFGMRTIQVETGPRGVSRSVGCAGHRSIAPVSSRAVMWLSERGFEYFDGRQIILISRPVQKFVDTINWSAIAADRMRPAGLYYERRHEYWCVVPRTGNDTAIFVYRPPQEGSPPATYIFRRGDLVFTGLTLTTDASGYVETQTDSSGVTVSVDANGYVTLDSDQSGTQLDTDDAGYIVLPQNDPLGAVLFRADTANDVGVPHEGTANGFIVEMEKGDADVADSTGTGGNPINLKLEGRPFLFGDPVQRKRARLLRARIAADKPTSITARIEVDGVQTHSEVVNLATSEATKPAQIRLRVNGRGQALVPIITSTDPIQVQTLEIEAEFLRRV